MRAAPELPPALAYLWGLFGEIAEGVAGNGWTAPQPGWADIAAWQAVTGAELLPWEARAIVRLGAIRAAVTAERSGERDGDTHRADRADADRHGPRRARP